MHPEYTLHVKDGIITGMEAAARFDAIERVEEAAAIHVREGAEGWVWDCVMLTPGLSRNRDWSTGLPRYYGAEFIAASAAAFNGAKCFVDHGSGSVEDLCGVFRDVKAETAGMTGELHLLKSETPLRDKMLAAQEAKLELGLSISAYIAFDRAMRDGVEVMEARRLAPGLPVSCDLVTEPAAGGRIRKAVASASDDDLLAAARRELCKTAVQESADPTAPVTEHKEQPMVEETKPTAPESGAAARVEESVKGLEERVAKAEKAQRVAESRELLIRKLGESKLAEPLAKLVRERYQNAEAVTAEELDAEIKRVREAYAAVAESPARVSGSRIEVGRTPRDKMQVALDKLFGVRAEYKPVQEGTLVYVREGQKHDGEVPGFRGIQEAYIAFTGDRELGFRPEGAARVTEDWDAAGFANALGNTLHRRLIADYAAVDYGLDLVCPPREPHRRALADFRTHEVVRVGYLADLANVDPESTDWPEIAAPTDEKATYAATQFGGLVSVTRKHIINDDIGTVIRIVSRLGRAAKRTLARRLWNWAINNAAIYDGDTFFHANHSNLGSTALAAAAMDVVRTAMRGQTEKNSGEKIGIGPSILAVPIALEGTAKAENMREFTAADFTPNKVRYIAGANGERIIVNPLFTDVTDWYMFADPDEIQTFELGFLQGQADPQLFLADNQVVGKAFTSDRIQYKVRHEYEAVVVDYRGAYKQAVAG